MPVYYAGGEDHIAHYGVVGMKWGVRKAKAYQSAANSARRSGNTAKANKYQSKANAITSKNKRLAGSAYNYTKKESTAKTVAKAHLMGSYGALKYNQARGKGASRGKAFASALLYSNANSLTGGAMSVIEPRVSAKKRSGKSSTKTSTKSKRSSTRAYDTNDPKNRAELQSHMDKYYK